MPPSVSITSKATSVLAVSSAPLLTCSESFLRSKRCRNDTWAESMPPSIACSQLHSCKRLETKRDACGTLLHSKRRQRRLELGRPHIGPDHVAELDAGIGLELDLLAEAGLHRLRRHVDALAGHVVFPAVIGAAQAALLVAPEPQRHAAMGAEFVHQADAALRVAERDQALGQQLHAHRRAIRLRQLGRQQRRNPVAPEQMCPSACRGRSV